MAPSQDVIDVHTPVRYRVTNQELSPARKVSNHMTKHIFVTGGVVTEGLRVIHTAVSVGVEQVDGLAERDVRAGHRVGELEGDLGGLTGRDRDVGGRRPEPLCHASMT